MKTSFLIRRFAFPVVSVLGVCRSFVSAQTLNLHLQNSSTYAVTAYYGGGASVGFAGSDAADERENQK